MGRLHRPKPTSTFCKNILIFLSRLEGVSFLHFITDVVDDLVHGVERKSKYHNFRMLIGIEKPRGECPFGPGLSLALEYFCYAPTMLFYVRKEVLVSRVKPFAVAKITRHAL